MRWDSGAYKKRKIGSQMRGGGCHETMEAGPGAAGGPADQGHWEASGPQSQGGARKGPPWVPSPGLLSPRATLSGAGPQEPVSQSWRVASEMGALEAVGGDLLASLPVAGAVPATCGLPSLHRHLCPPRANAYAQMSPFRRAPAMLGEGPPASSETSSAPLESARTLPGPRAEVPGVRTSAWILREGSSAHTTPVSYRV